MGGCNRVVIYRSSCGVVYKREILFRCPEGSLSLRHGNRGQFSHSDLILTRPLFCHKSLPPNPNQSIWTQ